jgi:putative two-component system response regulator
VVDDDPDIANLLKRSLEREFDVVAAADGPAAIALAGAPPTPQLAILDVMMPGMDGFEVAQQVRAIPACKRMPIIFLTARDTAMDTIRGIQSGARAYLTKPFKLDELLAKVRSTLGR